MPQTMSLISSQTLGSDNSSVTFSSIPQTYKDLYMITNVRTTSTSADTLLTVTLNGDSSTSNYNQQALFHNSNGTISADPNYGIASLRTRNNADGALANSFGCVEYYFAQYTSTGYKPASMMHGSVNNSGSINNNRRSWIAGQYRGSSGINSIVFADFTGGGTIKAGSSFHLYGIS